MSKKSKEKYRQMLFDVCGILTVLNKVQVAASKFSHCHDMN